MEIMNYSDVVSKIKKENRVFNLLMGNGFSVAYDPSIFSYNALYKFVVDNDSDGVSELFDIFKTTNFELIMQQLDITKKIAAKFGASKEVIAKIGHAEDLLKNNLVQAIKDLHPEHVFKIAEEKSLGCADFFKLFLDKNGEIFTSNYDVLMYWVLMRNGIPGVSDGFGREYDPDEEFDEGADLTWGKNSDIQNIHYLHGALPLFDNGLDIVKETYTNNDFLVNRIRKRIDAGHYPVFVSAGTGKEKLNQIRHNPYLAYCYDRFSKIEGSLVTFGFNFGEFDNHIIHAINNAAKLRKKKKLYSVYIGVYSDDDIAHIEKIKSKFKNIKIHVFETKSATVWKKLD